MTKYDMDGFGHIEHRVYQADSVGGQIETALRHGQPDVVRTLAANPTTRKEVHEFRQGFVPFLSYASEDRPAVLNLYTLLRDDGYDPWLDVKKLIAGQQWKAEIKAAQRRADVGIVCCSETSVSKTGVVQAEIKEFLELQKLRPSSDIFTIPIRLAPCDLPPELLEFQYVDLFAVDGYEKLTEGLDFQALRVAEKRKKRN
jgi:hypothetical protein